MSIFKKAAPNTNLIKMFSIRDAKVDAYMRPFFARTTPEALRIWTDSVNGDTGFAKHPEDYMLFEVGAFCELSGMVQTLAQPIAICGAFDVLQPRELSSSLKGVHDVFPGNQSPTN